MIATAGNKLGRTGPGWHLICPTCLGCRRRLADIRPCECVVDYFFATGEKLKGPPHGWDSKGRPFAYRPLKPGKKRWPVAQALYTSDELIRIRRRNACRAQRR